MPAASPLPAAVIGGRVRVVGTEIESSKHARAVAHLAEAGLGDVAEVRLSDGFEYSVWSPTAPTR